MKAILAAAEHVERAGHPATEKGFHWLVLDALGVPPATDDTPLRGLGTLGNHHISRVLDAYRAGGRASGVADDEPPGDFDTP